MKVELLSQQGIWCHIAYFAQVPLHVTNPLPMDINVQVLVAKSPVKTADRNYNSQIILNPIEMSQEI